jgi:UDP-glucose 4-epimerase
MRYLVTGGSGFVGTRLVETLAERPETEALSVVDLRAPQRLPHRAVFQGADVSNADALRVAVSSIAPDAIVHLACAGASARDADALYQNDVGATNAVLEVAAAHGVAQVVVVSSAAAYGAFADNPVPLTEDCAVRGATNWDEARVRAVVDRLCQLWAVRHPDRAMTIVRPAPVLGPGADPSAVRAWSKRVLRCGGDHPVQFVHVHDLVAALVVLLEGRHGGVFNVAGEGTLSAEEGARIAGVRRRRVPLGGNLDFARYPWVVSTERLRRITGWAPRYSSSAALESGVAS